MAIKTTRKKTPKPMARMEAFAIQLATVVVGIVITFGGSGLITRCSERREIAHILEMVKDELQKNASLIGNRKSLLLYDYNGSLALRPYIYNPREMHPDSLSKYMGVVSSFHTFSVVTNSFEVLKSSSQVQSIRNKELLRDLFTTYENIKLFEKDVAEYNSLKEQGINDLFFSADIERYISGGDQDNALLFGDMMKRPLLRNFVVHATTENWSFLRRNADLLLAEITETTELLDKEMGQ